LHEKIKEIVFDQILDFEDEEDRNSFKTILIKYSSVKFCNDDDELIEAYPDPPVIADLIGQYDKMVQNEDPAEGEILS